MFGLKVDDNDMRRLVFNHNGSEQLGPVIREDILEPVYGTEVTVQTNPSTGRPHVMLGKHET